MDPTEPSPHPIIYIEVPSSHIHDTPQLPLLVLRLLIVDTLTSGSIHSLCTSTSPSLKMEWLAVLATPNPTLYDTSESLPYTFYTIPVF